MAYNSVITDAIEGYFAFDIEADQYTFDTKLGEETSYSDAFG